MLDEQREEGERFGDVCRVSELKMRIATLEREIEACGGWEGVRLL